ncbi:hypothetical protein ACMA1D_20620 [Streptomyces sp. 796.1]|uniref:hypothetical protein n=1 Tax=Streptomyces sp. 796.1 TaxID=3163029 RepID=UPI0039C979CB
MPAPVPALITTPVRVAPAPAAPLPTGLAASSSALSPVSPARAARVSGAPAPLPRPPVPTTDVPIYAELAQRWGAAGRAVPGAYDEEWQALAGGPAWPREETGRRTGQAVDAPGRPASAQGRSGGGPAGRD